ncbi:alanine racemase [Bradyrhizobium japonicum]|uniref:alanine racemase n=1 Tax=Bradyrhizobium japonicum TaxID=375 RepID=UPI000693B99A|nr:alanine racemase [Bradyrhizobium japonicum]
MSLVRSLETAEVDAFYTLNEGRLASVTREFTEHFSGRVLYAVKANPLPKILHVVSRAGVAGFDVASLAEARLVHSTIPQARSWFMNPVKSRRDIERTFRDLGVRDYVIDCEAELRKLLEVLPSHDPELRIFIRFQCGRTFAVFEFSGKFGVSPSEACRLLSLVNAQSRWATGLSFHAGSQTIVVDPYLHAIRTAVDIIEAVSPAPTALDIGGGFPGHYLNVPYHSPLSMLSVITKLVRGTDALKRVELFCEPGRALVHDSISLFCRVILRKGGALYCGAGIYSGLLPGRQHLLLPARAWREGRPIQTEEWQDFIIFGPTCDSTDRLGFSYSLPRDLSEGDWIEFQNVGAYPETVRFNGFSVDKIVTVGQDELTMCCPPPFSSCSFTSGHRAK